MNRSAGPCREGSWTTGRAWKIPLREAREETGLELVGLRQSGAYSDPARDPRQHNISVVFTADGHGQLRAGDDAAAARVFPLQELPSPLCF